MTLTPRVKGGREELVKRSILAQNLIPKLKRQLNNATPAKTDKYD